MNLVRILPSFGDIAFQYSDGSIAITNLDKLSDRQFLSEADYYKQ